MMVCMPAYSMQTCYRAGLCHGDARKQAGSEIEEVRPHLPQGGGADISRISALQKRTQIVRYAMTIFLGLGSTAGSLPQ